MNVMERNKRIIVFWTITLLGVALRMIGISRPLLGNFSTKGCVYAMIARNFSRDIFQWLYPQIDVLVSGKPGLHLLEFPWVAYLIGIIYRFFGGNLDFLGRFVSVFFFFCSCFLLYYLIKNIFDERISLFSLGAFIFLPLNIIYSQSFQLESAMITFTLLSIFSLYRWLKDTKFWQLIIFFASYAFLLLLKVQCLYLIPIFIFMIFIINRGKLKKFLIWIIIFLSIVPTVAWFWHVWKLYQVRSDVYFSIFYTAKVTNFPDLRIFSFEFYKMLIDNLSGIVFTPIGFTLLVVGLFLKPRKTEEWIIYAWLACVAAYFLIIPRKVYEINYYLMPIVPIGSIFIARGITLIMDAVKDKIIFKRVSLGLVMVLILGISMRYAFNPSFVTPESEKYAIETARAAKKIIPQNSKVIASLGSGIGLLYYMDRKGWPFIAEESKLTDLYMPSEFKYKGNVILNPAERLEYLRKQKAEYFISAEAEKLRQLPLYSYLKERYYLVEEDEHFVIFDLTDQN